MENNRSFLSEPGAAAMDQDQAPSPSDENLDFDEDTLKAMAKVYLEEGDKEDGLKEPLNAIYFYTEGLQVNCKDDKLNAKLYSNRATAYFHLGSYQEALNDATAAVKLEPTLIKAIETGASACVQLQCYEDAITWCDKGLAIDKDNDTLLDLCAKGSSHQSELQESKQSKLKCEADTNAVKDQQIEASAPTDDSEEAWYSDDVNANDSLADLNDAAQYLGIDLSSLGNYYYNLEDFKKAIQYHERDLNMANEVGDKAREGRAYANLGNAYDSLGDFRKAIEYHECHLKVAEELQDRAGEGRANARLGNTYDSMGDFKKAIEYHECHLKIAKEVGDKAGEGMAYSNLGNAFDSLGDLKKAIEYYEHHLKFAKELGDRSAEGFAYSNLGNVYQSLRDFHEAIGYHERHLKIAKEIEDTIGEELAYTNLGNAYDSLEDFKTASEYYESHLKIAQEVGDRFGEGCAYANLGNAHNSLGDFKKATEYYKCELKIAKEIGDRAGEGRAYANLGNASHSLGDFKKVIDYHGSHLKNAKEVGDRAGEGCAYGNLGNAYNRLGDFQKAIECHERRLTIAKEVGDRVGEGRAYANLGNAYHSLEDFKKSIEYHELHLKIAVNVGDRAEEGRVYGSLGNAYDSLGDFKKAIEYFRRDLQIVKEVGGSAEKAKSFFNLGQSLESKGLLNEAHDCYYSIVKMLNEVRQRLLFKDEWNISYRHFHSYAYTYLWRLLLKQGEVVKALLAAEQGRAQALQDLLNSKYATKTEETIFDTFSCLLSNTVFMALEEGEMIFWIIQNGNVQLRRKKIVDDSLEDKAIAVAQSLINDAFQKIGVRGVVKCEDRSLVRSSDDDMSNKRSPPTISQATHFDTNPLRVLYDIIISPISDLIHGSELTFVPEGSLCLAPYAAFMDSHLKYLCDYFKIRLLPSLSTFKLIADCSADYHLKSGALLVGDPCLEEVIYQGRKLIQLPSAKQEVEMIGEILDIAPLTGKEATKDEVLRRLPSVALVHIAAHGSMETGEIALAPNITRASKTPVEKDYLLTMKDVLSNQLRARLVVLSCCHSARGEIKAEGVVGIARAFLGAGARSVLVSLWAIDDEATLEFMKSFYSHLAERRSTSEALNRAMKRMRDSDKFREVKYWAPFVLIGDDVTLDFAEGH